MDSYILQDNIYSLSFFHLPLESFSLQSRVCVYKADFLPAGPDAPPAGGRVWFLFLKTRKEILLQRSEDLTAIQILIHFTHQHCHFKNLKTRCMFSFGKAHMEEKAQKCVFLFY
ncbi:putative tyrosine-protein phosphatase auxilin [Platysternon megacephalum]|uniref:Putative tyrosine-protein phosphatase auxilin n=1 Tax=Platysternon megacephalum TaxID=55544 RepID=A0A4D9EU29_9SAUR|nr:putative tyrosine-protein phosphatase auxilin [Platysternon megacephalum]